MKLKKVVSFITCMTLIASLTAPVYGASTVSTQKETVTVIDTVSVDTMTDNQEAMENAKVTKEQAQSIAKKAVKEYFDYDINDKDLELRTEFRHYYASKGYVWQLNWNKYGQNSNLDINVNVNSITGKVISANFNDYKSFSSRPKIPTITDEEAKIIAESFMKKVFPKEYKEVKLKENASSHYDTSYQFMYQRYINDIPYANNAISVTVDGVNGTISGIYNNWDDKVNVPAVEKIIDKDAAENVFRDNIEMELAYIPCRNENNYDGKIKEVKLVYKADYKDGYMVDAKEGTMINTVSKTIEERVVKDISDERKAEINKLGNIKKLSEELSEEKANEIIITFMKEILGEGYTLQNIRYLENEDYYLTKGKKSWSGRFSKKEGYHSTGGNIVVDALTGQLIAVNEYNYREEQIEEDYKPVITWEEGYDKAIEAIATYFPNRIMDIDTKASYEKREHYMNGQLMPEYTYYYSFGRIVNGLTYRDDEIRIEIDTKDGSIQRISCQWNDEVKFPEISTNLSKSKAEDIYFEKYKPELMYSLINDNPDDDKSLGEVKLIYRLESDYSRGYYIDAYSEKFINYSGQEINDEESKFDERIKDHPAKKELSLLAAGNVLDKDNFDINHKVTRMEAVKMLVLAKGYRPYMTRDMEKLKFTNINEDDKHYKYLQMAVEYGIIKNSKTAFQGNDKITREELAELIINLLGYQDVAEIDDMYKVTFNDAYKISKDLLGDVAICHGLGIMKPNDMNAFKPSDHVTMVDLALAVFNTLSKIKDDRRRF